MGVSNTSAIIDGNALIAELGSFNRHLRAANKAPFTNSRSGSSFVAGIAHGGRASNRRGVAHREPLAAPNHPDQLASSHSTSTTGSSARWPPSGDGPPPRVRWRWHAVARSGALQTNYAAFARPATHGVTAHPPEGYAIPPVRFTLPDGNMLTSDQPDIDRRLSAELGREVTLTAAAPSEPELQEYWPLLFDRACDQRLSDLASFRSFARRAAS